MSRVSKALGIAGIIGTLALVGCNKNDDIDRSNAVYTSYGWVKSAWDGDSLSKDTINKLEDKGISPMEAAKYGRSILRSEDDVRYVVEFINLGLSPETAQKYANSSLDSPTLLSLWEMSEMYKARVSPDMYDKVSSVVSPTSLIDILRRENIPFDYVVSLTTCGKDLSRTGLSVYTAKRAYNAGIDPVLLGRYHENFDISQALDLAVEGINPEDINRYQTRTSLIGLNVFHSLKDSGISAKEFNEYREAGFTPSSSISLKEKGISGIRAREYGKLNAQYSGVKISAEDIISFEERQIPFSDIEEQAKKIDLENRLRNSK